MTGHKQGLRPFFITPIFLSLRIFRDLNPEILRDYFCLGQKYAKGRPSGCAVRGFVHAEQDPDQYLRVMISIDKIGVLAEEHRTLSLRWVTADGSIASVDGAVVTSLHAAGDTINIRILASGQIRKVNKYSIISINGEEAIV